MLKKGFTIIEISVVFLIILGATFMFLPKGIESTKQAKIISKWIQTYSEAQYMFSVMETQMDIDGEISTEKFRKILKTHLRIVEPLNKVYKPSLKKKKELPHKSMYLAEKYYLTNAGEIIGFNWVNKNCNDTQLCSILTFDLNGVDEPNIFGEDIFGINIYKHKISAFGEDIDLKIVKQECSKSGIYCSYHYLIGGRFE